MACPSQSLVRLTYFKGRGLGELIRFMLAETGTEYEERVITKELLSELRERGELFFQQLPLLEIDGLKMVQSGAIVRYLARKHNMCGCSPSETYQCDMIAEGLKDLRSQFTSFSNYALKKTDPEAVRESVCGMLPRYLQPLNDMLERNNGGEEKGFLLGEKISYADVSLLEILEHVFESYPDVLSSYPYLKAFRVRMLQRPTMQAFYSSGHRHPPIDDAYIVHAKHVLGRN